MHRCLTALLICAFTSTTADAKCAMWGLVPDVLTPTNAAISPDGGILVGALDAEDGTLDKGDVANQPGWRIKLGGRAETPTVVVLAPGLAVYKLPSTIAGIREVALIDDKRATVGKVTIAVKTPLLGAPRIKRITHDATQGRKPSGDVMVHLGSAVPDGAVALVIADAKGNARSWGRVAPGKDKVHAYDRKRCRVLPNGTVESKPGDRVVAFWVDASGRKSAQSAAITVAAERPDASPDDED